MPSYLNPVAGNRTADAIRDKIGRNGARPVVVVNHHQHPRADALPGGRQDVPAEAGEFKAVPSTQGAKVFVSGLAANAIARQFSRIAGSAAVGLAPVWSVVPIGALIRPSRFLGSSN
jgi:hypothetical protein